MLDVNASRFVDFQKVRIQETQQELPRGSIPRRYINMYMTLCSWEWLKFCPCIHVLLYNACRSTPIPLLPPCLTYSLPPPSLLPSFLPPFLPPFLLPSLRLSLLRSVLFPSLLPPSFPHSLSPSYPPSHSSLEIILRAEAVEMVQAGDRCDFIGTLIVVPDVAQLQMEGELWLCVLRTCM